MDVAIEVANHQGGPDDLHSLRQWMAEEDALRGRVRLVPAAPEPGALGGVVETLTIALGPGGVATALAGVLITWIRRRAGNVVVKVSEPGGKAYEFSASNVRTLSAEDLKEITEKLARDLGDA
ncbi:effector-associated constant component EACC1 [Amycolatopsis sp. cmx-4-68]|uniref:effector-associated constant component EACC1 n=1 Tax=Amycolatopsis sp. cmx-4-68 TaxID=2790938 RepID=UPI00397AF54B